jgi:hypothetical protein
MKKALFGLFVLAVLFSGCSNNNANNYYGSLTVDNSPAGYSFIALVYQSDTLPTTYAEYTGMTTSSIAGGDGVSPIKIAWLDGTKSGNYLVSLLSGITHKIAIVNFNNAGEATVDWDTMSDVPSPF